ncbi:lactadherin-like [Pomacea canaliculata]|uniref:lactadherin-like n=1 Tax=Pomacea canaliculata TaxID=400727 RepID=UPI000D72D92E|nr:lactadherin-like [Pomacea canaliculata]
MGLENYQIITDKQIQSSSHLNEEHKASMGRLTQDYSSGAPSWIPAVTDKHPWIQVNFEELKQVSGVLLQGRPTGQFHVQHSIDGITFTDYTDSPSTPPYIFRATDYGNQPSAQLFNRNIVAQYIRIVPVDATENLELRFNVVGCNPSPINYQVTTVSPSPVSGQTPTAVPPNVSGQTPTTVNPSFTTPSVCLVPMGLESSYIVTPGQLTSSSYLDTLHGPDHGRLYSTVTFETGGSWIPKVENTPWIQVDLRSLKLISGVMTQGSPDTDRWTTSYTISYSIDGNTFTQYTSQPGDSTPYIFTGNTDRNTPVRNLFNRDVLARYVRLYPISSSPLGYGLRFDLLGCRPDIPPTGFTPTASPSAEPGVSILVPIHVCNVPMGLSNPLVISNSQLRASSYLDMFHMPDRARIFTEQDGPYASGWRPSVSNDRQWIEVDFLTSYAIGGISTQGSADSPYWVTRYEIYYSNDGQNFYPVPTSGNQIQNIFEGNTDQNTPVMHLFPVIHARYIRIRPTEYHGEIALRFNIFGCESPSATPRLCWSAPRRWVPASRPLHSLASAPASRQPAAATGHRG